MTFDLGKPLHGFVCIQDFPARLSDMLVESVGLDMFDVLWRAFPATAHYRRALSARIIQPDYMDPDLGKPVSGLYEPPRPDICGVACKLDDHLWDVISAIGGYWPNLDEALYED